MKKRGCDGNFLELETMNWESRQQLFLQLYNLLTEDYMTYLKQQLKTLDTSKKYDNDINAISGVKSCSYGPKLSLNVFEDPHDNLF